MTRRRTVKLPETSAMETETVDDFQDFTRLDIFAVFASVGVSKRMEDPAAIAHESYQIAHKMRELSDVYRKT